MTDNTLKGNKKAIIGTIIGIVSMLIIIVGATYAYWNTKGVVNFNTATITYETRDNALIVLNGTSALLTLGTITGPDMKWSANDVVYYAGEENKTKTPTEVTVGVATYGKTNDINTYRCQYTLSLTHGGTNDIIDKFLSESYTNRSAGQIILTVNGEEYDLNDGFPSTISGYLNVSRYQNAPINVGLKFVNLSDVDQDYLINTNGYININVASNGFTCEQIGTLDIVYWGYEKSNNNTPTYSNTAQNKVKDYRDLHWGVNTFNADVALILHYGIFPSLAGCESSEVFSEPTLAPANVHNIRCVQSPSTGYIVNMDVVHYSADTEAECLEIINNAPNYYRCEYNSTTEKWDLVFYSKLPVESLQECQKRITVMSTEVGNEGDFSCTLASNTQRFYYQVGEYISQVDSLSDCENMITVLEESNDFISLMENQYVRWMDLLSLVSKNNRCEQPQMSVFVKETTGSTIASTTNNEWNVYLIDGGYYYSLDDCNSDKAASSDECIVADNAYQIEFTNSTWGSFTTKSACEEYYDNNDGFISPICRLNSYDNKYYIYDRDETLGTLENCQNALTSANYSTSANARCVNTNYVIEYNDSNWSTFNDESSCESYIYNNNNYYAPICKLNTSDNKYYIYDYETAIDEYFYSQDDCLNIIATKPSNITASCQSVYTIKYLGSSDSFKSELECLSALSENFEIEDSPKCEPKYQNGDIIHNSKSEICGIFNNNVLCYNPAGINNSNIEATLSPYTNYFNCSSEFGAIDCYDSQNYYQAAIVSYNDIYNSNLVNIMDNVGCSYDDVSGISCYTREPSTVVETTTHNPFPSTTGTTTYYENTFAGATSITVKLTYQTYSNNPLWSYVRLYQTNSSTIFGTYANFATTIETLVIPGNYLKIEWYNKYSSSYYLNYYGFKAEIYPNY